MSNTPPAIQHPAAERTTKREDCLTCRLTGFAAFTGLGTYAIWEARRQGTFAATRPPGGARAAGKAQAVIGFVFISLGIGRLIL